MNAVRLQVAATLTAALLGHRGAATPEVAAKLFRETYFTVFPEAPGGETYREKAAADAADAEKNRQERAQETRRSRPFEDDYP